MDVADVHIQRGENTHGASNRVGNVVKLQIQKDLMAPAFDLPDDLWAFGTKQLHADLDERFALCEFIQKGQCFLPARKIAGHNYVFTHYVLLLYSVVC